MGRIYAFTDESGAFGWDLDNKGVSKYFIVTAIIVKEKDLDELRNSVENIRKKYFQSGEMKSSHIGKKTDRRKRILAELLPLPFSVFAMVFDKSQMLGYPGLRYKQSFYKFLNNIVHKELRRAFKELTIVADEIGGSEYMKSFSMYVKGKTDIPDLLGEAEFFFENSEKDAQAVGSIFKEVNFEDGVADDNYKVALVIFIKKDLNGIRSFSDYHWYRQGIDGLWSHKLGGDIARNYDDSGNCIYMPSPEGCNTGEYSYLLGYFEVSDLSYLDILNVDTLAINYQSEEYPSAKGEYTLEEFNVLYKDMPRNEVLTLLGKTDKHCGSGIIRDVYCLEDGGYIQLKYDSYYEHLIEVCYVQPNGEIEYLF